MKIKIRLSFFLLIIQTSLFAQFFIQPALVPYRVGDLWGYSDTTGRIVIKPKYSNTSFFYFDSVATISLNGKMGIINDRGIERIPCKYDKIEKFNDYFLVHSNKLQGLYTRNYKVITPPQWNNINGIMKTNFYCVTKDNKSGVIKYDEQNKTTKTIIPLKYSVIYNDDNYNFVCQINNQRDYYDTTGKKLTRVIENDQELATDIAMAAYDKELLSFNVKKISNTSTPTFIITKTNRENNIVTYIYDTIRGYDKILEDYLPYNLIPCKRNGKWGVINIKGKQLLANEFDTIKIFSSKTCEIAALKNGVYTLFDSVGTNNVTGTYDQVERFYYRRDILLLKNSNLYGLYNFEESYLIPTEYKSIQDIQSIKEHLFFEVLTPTNKKGYIDTKNRKFYTE